MSTLHNGWRQAHKHNKRWNVEGVSEQNTESQVTEQANEQDVQQQEAGQDQGRDVEQTESSPDYDARKPSFYYRKRKAKQRENEALRQELQETKQVQTNLILPGDKMWIYGDVYEYELNWVKEGSYITAKPVGLAGEEF